VTALFGNEIVLQVEAFEMPSVAAQQEKLALRVVREVRETLADEQLELIPSLSKACFRCIDESGLQDKSICYELEIDPGVLSRARTGQANFPPDKIDALMDLCGNEIPLRWQALKRHYGLVKLKGKLEAELEIERQKNAELELKLRHIEEFMRATK